MPLLNEHVQFFASSAAGFLGGSIGAQLSDVYPEVAGISTAINSVFPALSGSQRTSGYTDYRCFYVKNNSPDTTAVLAQIGFWSSSVSYNYDSTLTIGLGTSAANGTEQVIASPTTAPSGVTFSRAGDSNGLIPVISFGPLPPGQHRAFWLRRQIPANYSPWPTGRTWSFQVLMSE